MSPQKVTEMTNEILLLFGPLPRSNILYNKNQNCGKKKNPINDHPDGRGR